MMDEGPSLEVFTQLHQPQLQAIGFPQSLVPEVYAQIAGGKREELTSHFELYKAEHTATGYALRSKVDLKPGSRVFILQHAWESDGGAGARKQLLSDAQLLGGVEELLGIVHIGREGQNMESIEKEMVGIMCGQTGRSEEVARKALVDTGYDLIAAISQAETLTNADCKQKGTRQKPPRVTFEEFKQGMSAASDVDSISDDDLRYLYDDYLRKNATVSSTDRSGSIHCGAYSWVESSEDGTITATVPLPAGTKKRDIVSKLQTRHWKFGIRGSKPIFDGDFSGKVVSDECFWVLEGDSVSMTLQKAHPGEVWRSLMVGEVQLSQREVEEMRRIAGCRREARVDKVWERMWYVNQTYQAVTPEGSQKPVWYLMEKHGLALTHSDQPNFICRPFANAITGRVVSLVWPVVEVERGDSCTRDCVPHLFPGESSEQRTARKDAILSCTRTGGWTAVSSRRSLTPPTTVTSHTSTEASSFIPSDVVKLYINGSSHSLKEWSSAEGYAIVGTSAEADVVLGHPLPHKTMRGQLVAGMGGDECLVSRGKLCVLARDKEWFAKGIDVRSEPAGILRKESLLSSWRILLPAEKGAPIQPRVTRNKIEMIRWAETAPCIASQFFLLTVLHNSRRCCLQFSVVVKPPQAMLHPCPRVRLAESEAGSFNQWNTAALVTSPTVTAAWSDVLREFTKKYKTSWHDVQAKINHCITALFTLALSTCTISPALYTVDVLLKSPSLEPVIIGVEPIPMFPNPSVSKQCLDLLVGRTDPSHEFIRLIMS